MRPPAVAIAAAFAGGIALGLYPAVAPHVASIFFLAVCFAADFVLLAAGGHPSPDLLARLEAAGVRVLRTDRELCMY